MQQVLCNATITKMAGAGGGIVSTMAATRQASPQDLITAALRRLDRPFAEGACVVEVKSGYSLNVEAELVMLRADLCAWNLESPADLTCRIGLNPLHQRYFGGVA